MDGLTNAGFTFEITDTPAAGGAPGEVVILLHGFPEDRHCWDAVTPALAEAGYRVLAPDQRGYSPGARPTSRRAYTLSHLASDVLALADAAGVDRFHLVGHDWGAAVVWYLAAHHPERIISVAALSVPHPDAYLRSWVTSGQMLRSWYMMAFQLPLLPELALAFRGGAGMRAALVHTGLDPVTADRHALRAAVREALRGPLNWYRAIPFGLGDRTGRIEPPTLFMWSDRDVFISRAGAELCGRFVNGPYRLEVLQGVSHWLPSEAPDRVAASLVQHFAAATNKSVEG